MGTINHTYSTSYEDFVYRYRWPHNKTSGYQLAAMYKCLYEFPFNIYDNPDKFPGFIMYNPELKKIIDERAKYLINKRVALAIHRDAECIYGKVIKEYFKFDKWLNKYFARERNYDCRYKQKYKYFTSGLTDPSIFYTLDKAEEYLKSLRYEELDAVFEFDTGKFVKVSSDIEKIL